MSLERLLARLAASEVRAVAAEAASLVTLSKPLVASEMTEATP